MLYRKDFMFLRNGVRVSAICCICVKRYSVVVVVYWYLFTYLSSISTRRQRKDLFGHEAKLPPVTTC